MSLTRKFLSAMGIEDDKAEQIINAHLETVNPLKQERDDYKEKSEKYGDIQKELKTATDKLADYESKGDSWKVKYDALSEDKKKLQKDFDDYKNDVASKALLAKKKDAYRNLLKEAGVSEKRLDAVMRLSDFDFELGEDGAVQNKEALLEGIKKDWSDYIGTPSVQGADVSTPPAGNGKGDFPNTRAAQVAKAHYERIYGKGENQ